MMFAIICVQVFALHSRYVRPFATCSMAGGSVKLNFSQEMVTDAQIEPHRGIM